MKRTAIFFLVLCLLIGTAVPAMAAKPTFIKQIVMNPDPAVVGKKLTMKVNAKNQDGLTWYFVDPDSGAEYTARTITNVIKGLKISGTNNETMTIKKAVSALDGWSVYCQISGSGKKVKSDPVLISFTGKKSSSANKKTESDEPIGNSEENIATKKDTDSDISSDDEFEDESGFLGEEGSGEDEVVQLKPFTVKADGVSLYALDRKGKPTGDPQSEMRFEDAASFAVKAEGVIQYLTVNGIQLVPNGEINEMILRNITEDSVISARVVKSRTATVTAMEDTAESIAASDTDTEASENNDASAVSASSDSKSDQNLGPMVTVTCENCRFTGGGIKNKESGQVPSGTQITVIAGSNGNINTGYSINGGAYEQKGMVTFKYVVTEDTIVTMKKN